MAILQERPDAIAAAEREAEIDRKVRQTELAISVLLRVGVVISIAIIIAGTIVTFISHPDYLTSADAYHRVTGASAGFPTTPAAIYHGLLDFQGGAIVMIGLYLLILTPVMRVGVSIIAFAHERDRAFVAITAFVFLMLVGSLVLGKGSGG
ncbi:DUF1634 domain-containing protein [bacterium]|jgi:uncharacterized membrane protein|nr:DUF1634 domain-containing protein [bacterium]